MTIERTGIFRYVGEDNSFTQRDYLTEAQDLVTAQFKNKDVFNRFIQLLISSRENINPVLDQLMVERSLHNAVGSQLDIIGEIVGQPRIIFESSIIYYFGFEGASGSLSFGTNSDDGVGGFFKSTFDSEFGSRKLNDDEYRRLIKLKILKNTSNATSTALVDGLEFLFGSSNRLVYQEYDGRFIVNIGRSFNDVNATVFQGLDEVTLANMLLNVPLGVILELQEEETLELDFVTGTYNEFVQGNTNSPSSFSGLVNFSRSSTGTYFDSNGVLQTAAVDEARFNHDPVTNEPLGLLIEEERTNSLLDNRDVSTANWFNVDGGGTSSVNITQNQTGIDGAANTAWTLEDSSTDGTPNVGQDVAVSDDNSTHVRSFFVKKDNDESRFPSFSLQLQGGSNPVSNFVHLNTQTGDTDINDATVKVVDSGDFWNVIQVVTNNGSGNTNLRTRIYPAAGSVLGDFDNQTTGSIVYDYGQIELNAKFATTPIETSGSATTRSADLALIDSLGDWYNSEEGTFLMEANHYDPTAGFEFNLSVNDGTIDNRILFYNRFGEGGGVYFESEGANFYSRDGVVEDDSFIKMAASYSIFDYASSVQGNYDFFTTTRRTFMENVSQINLGSNRSQNHLMSGHIKYLKYHPRKLSGEEMIERTKTDDIEGTAYLDTDSTLETNFAGGYSTIAIEDYNNG